jgi:uncharacterized membrane protein
MTREQFDREAGYGTAMSAARSMHARGIIGDHDYRKIETILKRKYRPIIGSLQPKKIALKP